MKRKINKTYNKLSHLILKKKSLSTFGRRATLDISSSIVK